jgi:hypothetical protein
MSDSVRPATHTEHPNRSRIFHGTRDISPDSDSAGENPARVEANSVVHGGTNDLKEFPG